jgi:hypothetical protein
MKEIKMKSILNWFKPKIKKEIPEDGMKAQDEGFLLSDNPFPKSSAWNSVWRDDWLFSARRFQ